MKVCFKVSIYTVSIMSKLTKMQREICSLISSWGYNVAPHKEIPTSEYFADIQHTRNSQLTVHH